MSVYWSAYLDCVKCHLVCQSIYSDGALSNANRVGNIQSTLGRIGFSPLFHH